MSWRLARLRRRGHKTRAVWNGKITAVRNAKEPPMNTRETAEAFTKLLKAGDHEGAAKAFNAPDIVSIEAMDGPMARIEGRAAVEKKGEWWYANHTVHSVTTEGPYVNGTQFAVRFAMDVTEKATGKRTQMQEVGVYTVKNGKIIEERFYY
jgi:ketosteroid isomerase-like protein